MTSLRMRVVEAGAEAIWNELPLYDLSYPEGERISRHVLDAMLDCLAENVVEWRREAWQGDSAAFTGMVGDLLAVLREDRTRTGVDADVARQAVEEFINKPLREDR